MSPDSNLPFSVTETSTRRVPSLRWDQEGGSSGGSDKIAVEAALCLEVSYPRGDTRIVKMLGITMRTPGNDEELALGFLLGEGVLATSADVVSLECRSTNLSGETIETLRVHLGQAPANDLRRVSRAVTTTSACGLCGRASLDGLPKSRTAGGSRDEMPVVSSDIIPRLPIALRAAQRAFDETGGSHAAALADTRGEIILLREDVGRHNAVDKLVGAAFRQALRCTELILVLSGRTSFELVQKAASAGLPMVVAVGAPSSAAVELAHASGITLIGFARQRRFNVYTHVTRVRM